MHLYVDFTNEADVKDDNKQLLKKHSRPFEHVTDVSRRQHQHDHLHHVYHHAHQENALQPEGGPLHHQLRLIAPVSTFWPERVCNYQFEKRQSSS